MIPTKVHCFFEQSGTFKNEFIKLGIPSLDYDILDDFGETDKIMDLFEEITRGGQGKTSLFDSINSNELIMAFFPCTYFAQDNALVFRGKSHQQKDWPIMRIITESMKRHNTLHIFYHTLCQLVLVCLEKKIPLIIENPATPPHYLSYYFVPPTIVDKDRRENGDYYKKPTQYWFFNLEPTNNIILEPIEEVKELCIEYVDPARIVKNRTVTRSLIHPQYANRFIRQYILDGDTKSKEPIVAENYQLSMF